MKNNQCLKSYQQICLAFLFFLLFNAPTTIAQCPTPTEIKYTVYSGDVTKLEWAAASGAQKYKVRYRPVGGSWTEINAPTNQRFLNALSLSTTYQYQVKIDCGSENGVWSSTQTFTTTNEHCDYPANYVTFWNSEGARIAWEVYPTVVKFKLKYKPKNLGMPWTEEVIYGHEKELLNLIEGATYKYKLKSKCLNYWTNWGPAQEFVAPPSFNDNTARKTQLNNQEIKLYPNPATNLLNIELEHNALIEVFNIVGQKVHTQEGIHGLNELNIATLDKGSYVVRMTTADNQVTRKFIKQ